MVQLHVRVVLANFLGDLAPQNRRLQHIGLVDRRDPAPPYPRRLESNSSHPLDFARGIDQRVPGAKLPVFFVPTTRLSIIEPSGQFPDNEKVDSRKSLLTKRRVSRVELGHHRSQIGETSQFPTQSQNRRFRTLAESKVVVSRVSNRSQENGLAFQAGFAGLRWEMPHDSMPQSLSIKK